MATYQYVYHMDGVSKTYPGGKKCFENIRLSFLPGVKIGVVGVNGAGKSTLMKIMAGLDKDFAGEAWSAEGAKVGYLSQEPKLNEEMNVRDNVMLGVAENLPRAQTKLSREVTCLARDRDDIVDDRVELLTVSTHRVPNILSDALEVFDDSQEALLAFTSPEGAFETLRDLYDVLRDPLQIVHQRSGWRVIVDELNLIAFFEGGPGIAWRQLQEILSE